MPTPDSCQGYGPVGSARRNAPAWTPTRAAAAAVAPSVSPSPTPWRLAVELTGCLRSLNHSTAGKLESLMQAQRDGAHVDLYCALEACNDDEIAAAENGVVDVFVARIRSALGGGGAGGGAGGGGRRRGGGMVVECPWWPYTRGVLGGDGRLRSEYRRAHPEYPYGRHHPQMRVDNTLAQAHKLQLVGETRRRLGRTYELVWRQRPDYVSTGLRWADARRALLSSAAPGAQYVSCRERMHASDRLSPRRG